MKPMKRSNEFRYSKLASILREQILSGFIKPGEFLMSENELCKHYQLSRSSVRKSLDELLKEGLVIKKPGQGTIVSPDLVITDDQRKVLRVVATSPSHFVDTSMQLLIDNFKEKYPNVDVLLLNFPHLNFWDSIRTSSEMGLHPDLIFITDRQFHDAQHINDFADLRNIVGDKIESIYPRMIEAFSQDGKIKALPITFSTVYLAYNPTLFDQFGVDRPSSNWSTDDFSRAAKQLTIDTDEDGIIDQYGFSLSTSLSRWPVIALQNQVDFRTGQALEPISRTLSYMHDLIYRNRVATLYQPNRHRINSDAFRKGKAAMTLTTSIEVAGWRNEGMDFEPNVAPLPFGQQKSTLLVSNAFMMPSETNDPELAATFLEHIYQPEIQQLICAQTQFLSALHPVNTSLWDTDYLESLNVSGEHIENSYFLHEMFADLHLTEDLENEFELYWAGLENADELANRLQQLFSSPTDEQEISEIESN